MNKRSAANNVEKNGVKKTRCVLYYSKGHKIRCGRCGTHRSNNCEIMSITMVKCEECKTKRFLLPTSVFLYTGNTRFSSNSLDYLRKSDKN